MGGQSDIVVAEEPIVETEEDGGIPDTVDGPLNDNMSDSGKLFGDLYVILRQLGKDGETKLVLNEDGKTFSTSYAVVGGEPVLTVIDPPADLSTAIDYHDKADYGWYAAETGVDANDNPTYEAQQSDYPALCVQPVASFERWGDISSKTGLTRNRVPLVITYDATFDRSECEVGEINGNVTVSPDGDLVIPINEYFIPPCGDDITPDCQWKDPDNGVVTYPNGVLWTQLIGEVHFGRLNLSRSPEAVLQAAFDEAINTINSEDTIAIEIDAAGRLLMTKNVYDETKVDTSTGEPVLIGTVKKAIDSPLENLALYVKLIQDGHLVTPGDERAPIDRSTNGGIPLWKLLELEDGPADAALRPTIDIDKMKEWGLDNLVVVTPAEYYSYYMCTDSAGSEVACLIWNPDPIKPELDGEWVANPDAINRILLTTTDIEECPEIVDDTGALIAYSCDGPFIGITTDLTDTSVDSDDFKFAAAFLAAAADKTGDITVDMVVYLNSILGINTVLGFSEYNEDGTPSDEAIDYSKNPLYFNFKDVYNSDRITIFGNRGEVNTPGGNYKQSTYTGNVNVLQGTSPNWTTTQVTITAGQMNGETIFDNIDLSSIDGFPNKDEALSNILGFTQNADDNLSVISFIHTYQIPELR
jgi:hypothetical protein